MPFLLLITFAVFCGYKVADYSAGEKPAKSHVSPLESRTISLVDGDISCSVPSARSL
jgi:hypothetical protein